LQRVRDEAVGFVAHPLQQKQRVGVALENHRITLPRQEHPLFGSLNLGAARCGLHPHLGEPHGVDMVDSDLGHRGQRHGELALAAIDDDQVRQIGLFFAAAEAALEHFEHHAEVVATGRFVDGFDAKMAIEILIRLAVDEGHHGPDGVSAVNRRNIEALDALRIAFQAQLGLEFAQHGLARFFLIMPLGKTLPGVFFRHLHQVAPVAPLRAEDLDPLALALG